MLLGNRMKREKNDTRPIKDLHVRMDRKLWEKIVANARDEKRPPVMHTVVLIERALGAQK